MKRSSQMRRTRMNRGTIRVGAAARARVKAGGVLSKGRPSVSLAAWREIVAQVQARAGGQCEVYPWLRGVDPHHVVSRGRGGGDSPENVIWLSRRAHEQVDAPFSKGRLVIEALGGGRFAHAVVTKADKWAEVEVTTRKEGNRLR